MTAIGDVIAVVAVLVGLGVTAWAMLVGLAFALPGATRRAQIRIASDATGTALTGTLWLLVPTLGVLGINAPHPGLKLVAAILLAGSLLIAAIGAAGLAAIVGERISAASGLSTYAGLVKGAAYLVAAMQLPILGWFVGLPLVLVLGLGAGFPSVLRRGYAGLPPIAVPEEVR
ncbi:hypothetical protein EON77_06035 [bacterium]|nr:MAG: hypothetical protein EON77_06035 [bacterium]